LPSQAIEFVELINKAAKQIWEKEYRGRFKKDIQHVKITNDNIAPGTIQIDRLMVQEFVAKVAKIAVAEIAVAVIDTAQIENLEAYVANITYAAIQNATIAVAQIADLTATVATIVTANIASARINFAQIDGLVANTALITEGVGGKLYINELAVTEANMVSLTVGELIVKGLDGKFYTLGIDGNGNVTTTEKQVSGDNVANNTLSGTHLIEDSITARELNVAQIFADTALINAIKAANIDVADLFAYEGFINSLHSNLIESNIGGLLKIQSDTGILISVKDALNSKADSSALSELSALVDTKVTTYYQNTAPATAITGDLWIDTDDGNSLYRWSGIIWESVDNGQLQEALTLAGDAQSTADLKIRTFAQTTAPVNMLPEDIGDLWVDTDDSNKLYRWSGSTWISIRDTSLDGSVSSLLSAIAVKTTTFYQAAQPTATAVGDLWIDTDDGNSLHRWNGSSWALVDNAQLQQALEAASDAQSTADGKIVTFAQTTQPVATSVGDIWIDTDDNNKLYRWNGSSWVSVQDTHLDSSLSALTALANGKTTTFYQSSTPTATATGDLWIKTSDNNKLFRWNGSSWIAVDDARLQQALNAAGDAQATADGKIVTFAQASQPTSSTVGDLWIDTDDNNKLYRYSGSAWVVVQDTHNDATLASHASTLTNLSTSVNSKTTIFYQTSAPTATATGDVWYDTDANPVVISRWNGTSWVNITTTALSAALAAASTAQTTADGKVRSFAQTTAPTGMTSSDVGDLWVDTDDNNKLYRYSGSAWVAVQDTHNDATLASHGSTLAAHTTALNSKTTIFYQTAQPTATATGDLWYDTDASPIKIYRWSGSAWVDITTVALSQALTAAGTAQATADGKVRTFAQTTAPTGMVATDAGDLWIDTDAGNKVYRWSGTAWAEVTSTELHNSAIDILQTGIDIKSTGIVKIKSGADLNVESGGDINIQSGGKVTVQSGGDVDLASGGDVNVKSGGAIKVESGGDINVASGGDINVSAGGKINVSSPDDIVVSSGKTLSAYATEEISLSVDKVNPGNPQLLTTDQNKWETTTSLANFGTDDGRGDAYIRPIPIIAVSAGETYTLTCTWRKYGTGASVIFLDSSGYLHSSIGRYTDTLSHTFTVPSGAEYIRVLISWTNYLSEIPTISPSNLNTLFKYKLESGDAQTGWDESSDDPASEVDASSIIIRKDELRISTDGNLLIDGGTVSTATDEFIIQNSNKTKVLFEQTPEYARQNADVFYCPNIIGNVLNTFPGGSIPWAGSIQGSINNIGKFILADSTLIIPTGTYTEQVMIYGFSGLGNLKILFGGTVTLNGSIYIVNSDNVTLDANSWDKPNIIASGPNSEMYSIYCMCSTVTLKNLHVYGATRTSAETGSNYGIYVHRSNGVIESCIAERTLYAGICFSTSTGYVLNCTGGYDGGDYTTVRNLGVGVYAVGGSHVGVEGTVPQGGASALSSTVVGTATPTATGGAAPTPATTRTYAVSAGYAVKTTSDGSSSVSWASGEPRQGSWTEIESSGGNWTISQNYNGFGALLLSNAANIVSDIPSGKTIASATLKIRRDASAGSSNTISCTLYQHGTASTPSGAPNTVLFAQAADSVSIAPNQEMTIALNASTITNLNNGACKGFGFKNTGGYGRYDIYGELTVTYS
jgi:hypothetical protein